METQAQKTIIPWSTARDKGLKFYFTGQPCKHGHIEDRYTLDKACVQCRRSRDYSAENAQADALTAKIEQYAKKIMLGGVRVTGEELTDFARTGKLPFRIISEGGYLMPGLEPELSKLHVREGLHKGGRVRWGIYLRECGSCVAVFQPGFPRAVATIKELFDAIHANTSYKPGKLRQLKERASYEVHGPEHRSRNARY